MASTATDMIVPDIQEQFQEDIATITKEMKLIVLDDQGQSKDTSSTMICNETTEKGEDTSKPTISSLPPEMTIKIFKYLDRVSSTCFGLTAKKFYPTHKELRGIVPLTACCLRFPSRQSGRILFGLLKEWMSGTGLVFNAYELKFVMPESKAKAKEDDITWKFYHWGLFDQSPLAKKSTKAKSLRRLELLRDEKEAGGWWEKGVWVDGEESGKGGQRWVELEYEGVEWEGDEDAIRPA